MPITSTASPLADFKVRQQNQAIYANAAAELEMEFASVRSEIFDLSITTMEAVCDLFTIIEPVGCTDDFDTIDLSALEERSFELIAEHVSAEEADTEARELATV